MGIYTNHINDTQRQMLDGVVQRNIPSINSYWLIIVYAGKNELVKNAELICQSESTVNGNYHKVIICIN